MKELSDFGTIDDRLFQNISIDKKDYKKLLDDVHKFRIEANRFVKSIHNDISNKMYAVKSHQQQLSRLNNEKTKNNEQQVEDNNLKEKLNNQDKKEIENKNPNAIDRKKREELCNGKVLNNLLSHEEYNYRVSSYDTFGDIICKSKMTKTMVKLTKPGFFNNEYELVMNFSGEKVIIKFNPDQDTDYTKRSKDETKNNPNFNYGNERFMNFELITKKEQLSLIVL